MSNDYSDYLPYVDVKDGLSRVVNNTKLYKRLLNSFLDPKHFESLRQHIAEKDMEKAEYDSHTIKGIAANLSLKPLFKITEQLDNNLKEKTIDEGVISEYEEILAKTIETVKKFIEEN